MGEETDIPTNETIKYFLGLVGESSTKESSSTKDKVKPFKTDFEDRIGEGGHFRWRNSLSQDLEVGKSWHMQRAGRSLGWLES